MKAAAPRLRLVVDTNVIISALIRPNGAPGRVLRFLLDEQRALWLAPEGQLEEVRRCLRDRRLARFVRMSATEAEHFMSAVLLVAEIVETTGWHCATPCRDPDDEMFLAAAATGRADFLITGDADLLTLSAQYSFQIVPPHIFLKQPTQEE